MYTAPVGCKSLLNKWIDGTRATLRGRYHTYEQEIEVHDHLTGRVERIRPQIDPAGATGHSGGDAGLMAAFVRAVRGEARALTTAREALESHLMAFAAEESRLAGRVVELDEMRLPAQSV